MERLDLDVRSNINGFRVCAPRQSRRPWRSETVLHASRRDRGRAPDAHRGSRTPGRPRLGEQLERTEAQRLADVGWIEWGGELIWVAGYTSGGAPYGLRVCDFDRADLEAMGLDVEALDDAGLLATAPSSIEESNDWLGNDDVPF